MLIVSRQEKTAKATMTKIRMAPSNTRLGVGASSDDATAAVPLDDDNNVAESPRLDARQPNLYCMPQSLHPSYRPLPLPVKLVSIILSAWTSAVLTWKNVTWFKPLAVLTGMRPKPILKEWIFFVVKTLVLTVFSQLLLQDIFLPPSRVSMATLKEKYCLPSTLSNYEPITIGNHSSLGVHFLKYENTAETAPRSSFDALYVIHGFGASSLSWLPPLPALVEQLGARVGLGHDAVGFGFTDRPSSSSEGDDGVGLYTTGSSATIAREILTKEVGPKPDSVAIFGHSLGGLTALKLALQLPRETSKLVVLSAPALGIRRIRQPRAGPSPWISRAVFKPVGSLVRKTVFYPAGGYMLRRVVGVKNFWKSGLRSVWGNPDRVSDSDALRFQWPSIGAGWERGLLEFARAQSIGDPDDIDDVALLREVVNLPNTTVAIVLGAKDKVIPTSMADKFLRDFPDVPVIKLEGLGHDAFEEDIDQFLDVTEKILADFRATEA